MQKFIVLLSVMIVLATPTMVVGKSRTLMLSGSVSVSAQAADNGRSSAEGTATVEAVEESERAIGVIVSEAFSSVENGENAEAVADASALAIATATAEAFASAVVQIDTEGNAIGCASSSAQSEAVAEAFAFVFAKAIAEAVGARGNRADASALASAIVGVTVEAYAEAYSSACAFDGGSITVITDSLASAIVTVCTRVFVRAFAAVFDGVISAEALAEAETLVTPDIFEDVTTIVIGEGPSTSESGGSTSVDVTEITSDAPTLLCSSDRLWRRCCSSAYIERAIPCRCGRDCELRVSHEVDEGTILVNTAGNDPFTCLCS